MAKADDLEKVERAIQEAEARLKAVQRNIEAIDAEVKKVMVLDGVLTENVKILKSRKIVAVAQEFKKAKEEQRRTKVRLTVLQNDREHYGKALENAQDFLKAARADQKRIIRQAEHNVIEFRSKDGKK